MDSLVYGDVPSGKGYDFDESLLGPEMQKSMAERVEEVKQEKVARAAKAKEKQKTGL